MVLKSISFRAGMVDNAYNVQEAEGGKQSGVHVWDCGLNTTSNKPPKRNKKYSFEWSSL